LHDIIVPEPTERNSFEDDADEELYGGNEMADEMADELLLQVEDKKGKKDATSKPIVKQQAGPEATADVAKSRAAAKKAFEKWMQNNLADELLQVEAEAGKNKNKKAKKTKAVAKDPHRSPAEEIARSKAAARKAFSKWMRKTLAD